MQANLCDYKSMHFNIYTIYVMYKIILWISKFSFSTFYTPNRFSLYIML